MPKYVVPLGEEIRHQRQLRLWTQQEFAYKTGLAKRTIERVERGLHVQKKTIEIISKALGIPPSDIWDTSDFKTAVFEGQPVLDGPTRAEIEPGKLRFKFVLDIDPDDDSDETLRSIGRRIHECNKLHPEGDLDIEIIRIKRSSIELTLDIPAFQAGRLLAQLSDYQRWPELMRLDLVGIGSYEPLTSKDPRFSLWLRIRDNIRARHWFKDVDLSPDDSPMALRISIDDRDFFGSVIVFSVAKYEDFLWRKYKLPKELETLRRKSESAFVFKVAPLGDLVDFLSNTRPEGGVRTS